MGVLADLRADLVAQLHTAKAPAFDYLPKTLNPPVKVIEPAEPYITDEAEGLVFGQVQVAYDVFVLARRATNASQVAQVDELLQDVIDALDDTDWDIRDVGQPFVLTFGETVRFLAAIVRVTTVTTLSKE